RRNGMSRTSYDDAIRDSRIATTSPTNPCEHLGTNGFFDCGSRKAAWRSSILLPLLQCSLRDLQFQRRLALREIIPLTPRSQSSRKRTGYEPLMSNVIRKCPESHP